MKNILLPTDFSANSMNAIEYAMHFFENWECNFYILNVQKISEYISDDLVAGSKTDSIYESIASDNKKLINELVKKLSKKYKTQSYTFQGLFDYDDFVAAVDQAVKFHSIDLIIMGTNGATSAKEVVFGSNTLQIIRGSNCPMLAIPENYKFKKISTAMFCNQNSEDFSEQEVKPLKDVISMHQAVLKIVELDENKTALKDQKENTNLSTLFKDIPYTYYSLDQLAGWTAINTATQLLNVDLNAIFVENKTLLERLFFGSDTSAMLYGTKVPLLLLKR